VWLYSILRIRLPFSISFMSVVCLFIGLFSAWSPAPDSIPAKLWTEKMDKQATIRFTQSSAAEKFSVVTGTNNFYLSPNVSSVSQLSVSYRFITASLNFVPRFIGGNNDDDIKGKTTGRGFGVNLNFDHWQQELSYNRVKGYYLENTKDYRDGREPGMPYIQFPKLAYTNYQGITAYSFNPKFSVNAVVSQTERQLKSAGSFIPSLLYRYYIIDGASGGASSQKSANFELLAGAGYQYTFVYKDVYLSMGLTPSYGYIFSRLNTYTPSGTITTHSNSPAVRLDARLGLGYNGRRFFAGAYTSAFSTVNKQQHTTIQNEDNRATVKVFVGYRFRAPAFVVKKMNKLDSLSSEVLYGK